MPECWKRGKTSVSSSSLTSSGSTRLYGPRRAAEQLVGVAGPRPLAHDLRAAARLDEDGVALLGQAPEERGDRHVERAGQPFEGGEAGRGLRVLDLGEHPLGDAGPLGQLADVQADLEAPGPHVVGDDLAQLTVGLVGTGVIDGHGLGCSLRRLWLAAWAVLVVRAAALVAGFGLGT